MDARQQEVFKQLGPAISALVAKHIENGSNLWMPEEIIFPKDIYYGRRVEQLLDAVHGIPPAERAVYAVHWLTEQGLTSYFYLLMSYLGGISAFREWIGYWTAQEYRHDQLLGGLAREAHLFADMSAIERMQFESLQAGGFDPRWDDDPYRPLAYTAIQEPATAISHGRLGARLKNIPKAKLLAIPMGLIAAEEKLHGRFYGEVVWHIFQIDPDRMLCSLWEVVRAFSMPGRLSTPHFKDLADVVMRLNVFGPSYLKQILEKLFRYWGVAEIVPKSNEAARAQQKLSRSLTLLDRMEQALKTAAPRTFVFPFLGDESFVL